MNIIKNRTLWLLMVGMLCMPVEQAKAEVDSKVIVGAVLAGAAVFSYGGYAIYQDYCDKVKQEKIILSHDEKVELVESLLKDQESSDINIQLLALRCMNTNKGQIERFIDKALKIAKDDNSQVIMTKHIEMAFVPREYCVDLEQDLQADVTTCSDQQRKVAQHEAGHAIATLFGGANKFLYLHKMDIQSDESRDGFIVGCNHLIPLYESESDLTEDQLKSFVLVDLGGFAAEFVFKDFMCEDEGLDGDDADYAGAHTDQIKKIQSQGAHGSTEDGNLIVKLFQDTVALITSHKDEVDKVALQLIRKKRLSADEIYELCGVEKPKLEVQRKIVTK